MIDTDEIRKTIAEIESRDTTFSNCAKLADLYAVLDHADPDQSRGRGYSRAAAPVYRDASYDDSDFLRVVSGKDPIAAWAVMDDLMSTLRAVNGRVYDSVMRRLKELA